MVQDIIHYDQDRFSPLESLEWSQVESLLHSGFDPRFCGTTKDADHNINEGATGDTLALFESFPHLVWDLRQKKAISVQDNYPIAKTSTRHIHVNLDYVLRVYAKALYEDRESQERAWKEVEDCLEHNGFNDTSVKTAISEEVYRSLTVYVKSATGTSDEQAMVLVRADRQLSCLDEDNYGSLGKRGRRYLDKSLFSHQVWTGYFKSSTEEVRDTKVKRAIHAMVYMASVGFAAISGLPASPRIQTSDNLALGETLKLRRPVEPGEMIVFQSAGWDDQTVRVNDTTTIDLMNDYGDYLLRISLRQGDDAIVFNSRLANGEWDHEKRARLKGTFLNPSFNIAVVDHRDRYEVLFSYRTVQYYAKIELNSLITRVSYSIDNGQSSSPLSDPLVVSTHDGVYALALANYRATSEIRPLDLQTEYDLTAIC